MSPAEREARHWIRRAAIHCERAAWKANDRRASDATREGARDRAGYWSGVAFHESERLARMRRACPA